ncbi:MAG TPA: glycosyltransferase, partial [Pyrinomonadaceae bacterium]
VLVGIVGRLTEIKSHRMFIEAAALYLKRQASEPNAGAIDGHRETGKAARRRARFVVIGDGHLRGELEAQVHARGIADHVSFTGTRSDPENFYAALDIVALTSLNEGTPLTLIEAMANARPVLATAVGGVVDLVGQPSAHAAARAGDGLERGDAPAAAYTMCERGVRVPTGDAEAFCDALHLLVADEALRRELGERGRAFVAEHYSKERLVRDVLNLYSELAPSPSVAVVAKPEGGVPAAVGSARVKGDG